MVIHLKQNYISHLPPGLHDGWQGPQPKHPGLIAPLFSVTNVTRKTYDTFRFPTVLNENMFAIGKVRYKNTKVLNYSSMVIFFSFLLTFALRWNISPFPKRSGRLSCFDWFICTIRCLSCSADACVCVCVCGVCMCVCECVCQCLSVWVSSSFCKPCKEKMCM